MSNDKEYYEFNSVDVEVDNKNKEVNIFDKTMDKYDYFNLLRLKEMADEIFNDFSWQFYDLSINNLNWNLRESLGKAEQEKGNQKAVNTDRIRSITAKVVNYKVEYTETKSFTSSVYDIYDPNTGVVSRSTTPYTIEWMSFPVGGDDSDSGYAIGHVTGLKNPIWDGLFVQAKITYENLQEAIRDHTAPNDPLRQQALDSLYNEFVTNGVVDFTSYTGAGARWIFNNMLDNNGTFHFVPYYSTPNTWALMGWSLHDGEEIGLGAFFDDIEAFYLGDGFILDAEENRKKGLTLNARKYIEFFPTIDENGNPMSHTINFDVVVFGSRVPDAADQTPSQYFYTAYGYIFHNNLALKNLISDIYMTEDYPTYGYYYDYTQDKTPWQIFIQWDSGQHGSNYGSDIYDQFGNLDEKAMEERDRQIEKNYVSSRCSGVAYVATAYEYKIANFEQVPAGDPSEINNIRNMLINDSPLIREVFQL